jgi:hypothetical protein
LPSSALLGPAPFGEVALGPFVSEPGAVAVESPFAGALAPFMSSAFEFPGGLVPPFAAAVPVGSTES